MVLVREKSGNFDFSSLWEPYDRNRLSKYGLLGTHLMHVEES